MEGARRKGKIVYSSWIAMQRAGEANGEACAYNDFALIKLRQRDVKRVNPSIPVFGGPRGKGGARFGDTVYTYGNSSIRGGQSELSPKRAGSSAARRRAGATTSTRRPRASPATRAAPS